MNFAVEGGGGTATYCGILAEAGTTCLNVRTWAMTSSRLFLSSFSAMVICSGIRSWYDVVQHVNGRVGVDINVPD